MHFSIYIHNNQGRSQDLNQPLKDTAQNFDNDHH